LSTADRSLDEARIAAVRQDWVQAVRDGDAERLANLVTDDVVAVLKNGRCITGKEALKAEFRHVFALYDVERKILSSGVLMRDRWVLELDEMDSTMTPRDGMEIQAHVKTVIVYARQADGEWKVARLMELLD
jgi:uncharacterized protein (TIGR02246 family)